MDYVFGRQDLIAQDYVNSQCLLLSNGLGGYSSMTLGWSATRCDQGVLVAAVSAPNQRITLVHRMQEILTVGDNTCFLSDQGFAGHQLPERGSGHLSLFEYGVLPKWTYEQKGITVTRTVAMAYGSNTVVLRYTIDNGGEQDCVLELKPFLKLAPKETALDRKKRVRFTGNEISDGTYNLYIHSAAALTRLPIQWETLAYPEDARDGRPDRGLAFCCCCIRKRVEAGQHVALDVVFSDKPSAENGESILREAALRQKELQALGHFRDPMARMLAAASDAYLARRDSTGGKTILAGYPLFSDWGRDTMIALPGCCWSTGRFEDGKSILKTFLTYERDGLVPNLFPEGGLAPMYNTADAALLLIDCVWQYFRRTGDMDFVCQAWPVMERIVSAYRRGTHHSIGMDADGLIFAGAGMDQVTWMDVCVDGVLPTPRHGKPVEINAYWYNALRVMAALAAQLGEDPRDYDALADQVKVSFVEKFWREDGKGLRDVLSGTKADEQIRCNQIWTVTQSFDLLSPEQEHSVVQTVWRHLYTPCGLRSLSSEDPEFRGNYGGKQFDRDMAYHQGTIWVYPLGAFYRAWLKVNQYSAEACDWVRSRLRALEPMLRQGCLGQLPEIYSGMEPGQGQGCYAQAWSVGELLRVFEELERHEERKEHV